MNPHNKLCFIHLPKCGGNSINEAIKKSMGMGLFSSGYKKIKASRTKRDAEKSGIDLLNYREKALQKVLNNNKLSFVTGHLRCSDETRIKYEEVWDFITLLRNPVDRWFSHYFFNVHKSGKHFTTNLNIEDYMNSKTGINIGSLYVQYFTNGKIENMDESIEVACNNLSKFKLAGILEDMNGFANNFHRSFGLNLHVKKKNVNPLNKSEMNNLISDEIKERVNEICQPDLKVYSFLQKQLQ